MNVTEIGTVNSAVRVCITGVNFLIKCRLKLNMKYVIKTNKIAVLKGLKIAWWGFFQHCIRRLIVLLPPNEFLHSSPEAPRTTQARETSASEERNYYQGI